MIEKFVVVIITEIFYTIQFPKEGSPVFERCMQPNVAVKIILIN